MLSFGEAAIYLIKKKNYYHSFCNTPHCGGHCVCKVL